MRFPEKIYHETYHKDEELKNFNTQVIKPEKKEEVKKEEPKKEKIEPKKEITEPEKEVEEKEEVNENGTLHTDTGDSE